MRILGLAAAAVAAHSVLPAQALAQESGFSGAYLGAEIGYSDSEMTTFERAVFPENDPLDFVDAGVEGEAFAFAGFAGWGGLATDHLYLGAEVAAHSERDSVTHAVQPGVAVTIEPHWGWSGAARIGAVFGANLAYAKLGWETREYELTLTPQEKRSRDVGGILYGLGFERMVGARFSVRGEVTQVRVDAEDSEIQFDWSGCGGGPGPNICVLMPVDFALEPEERRLTLGAAFHF